MAYLLYSFLCPKSVGIVTIKCSKIARWNLEVNSIMYVGTYLVTRNSCRIDCDIIGPLIKRKHG